MYACIWCSSSVGVSMSTGLPQCHSCASAAVSDPAVAHALLGRVISWTERIFGAGSLESVRFSFGAFPPVTGTVISFGQTRFSHVNGVSDLHIETVSHVPAGALGGILAHEMGHVLLFVDDKTLDPNPAWPTEELVCEGFCEVVRSLWLENSSDPYDAMLRQGMDTNITPVYGDGFRMMRAEPECSGSLAVLRDSLVHGGEGTGHRPVTAEPESGIGGTPRKTIIPMNPVPLHRSPTDRVRPVIRVSSHPGHESDGGATPSSPTRPEMPVKRIIKP